MTLLGFLVLLIVAAVCGSVGSALAGYTMQGCITKIIVGLIGALIGTWLSHELRIRDFLYYEQIPIFWSIIGSSLFVLIISLFRADRRGTRRK